MNNTEGITIQVGTFEGHPIERRLTAQEVKEAEKAGFTEAELINLVKMTYCYWQADC